MGQRGARRAVDPHKDVPKTPGGLPDDRFDGTDSGADGWDTPYPPATERAMPEVDRAEPGERTGEPAERGSPERARPARRVTDGTSYEPDGPDEPAGTPQR